MKLQFIMREERERERYQVKIQSESGERAIKL